MQDAILQSTVLLQRGSDQDGDAEMDETACLDALLEGIELLELQR